MCIMYLIMTLNVSCPKLYGNCAFRQNFHTMKLGEITVFYVVQVPRFNNRVRHDIQIF